MDIIDEDRGYDPRREAEITIGESTTQLQSYDKELQTILETAAEEPLLRCIDRCLWVYVDRNQDKSPDQKVLDFQAALDGESLFSNCCTINLARLISPTRARASVAALASFRMGMSGSESVNANLLLLRQEAVLAIFRRG